MEQNNTDSLGKRIASLRKSHGLTQEKLAEQLGVSPQAVSKWETDTSCPDITLLPRLAALFGVSTDALLGMESPDPQVVILEKEKTDNASSGIPFVTKEKAKKWHETARWSSISSCITAILICLVLLLRSITSLFSGTTVWNCIWPLLIFGLGLGSIFEHPVFGIVIIAAGAYEAIHLGLGIGFDLPWYVILLVIAIAVLAHLLIKTVRGKNKTDMSFEYSGGSDNKDNFSFSIDGYYLKEDLNFGNRNVIYPDRIFNGADIEANFGETHIDLTNVTEFSNSPVIHVECNFGTVTIYLPKCVRLTRSSETAFAAFGVKGEPAPDATQQVIVRGEVHFGSLEIVYR